MEVVNNLSYSPPPSKICHCFIEILNHVSGQTPLPPFWHLSLIFQFFFILMSSLSSFSLSYQPYVASAPMAPLINFNFNCQLWLTKNASNFLQQFLQLKLSGWKMKMGYCQNLKVLGRSTNLDRHLLKAYDFEILTITPFSKL